MNPFELFGPGIIILVPIFAAAVALGLTGIVMLVEKILKK